MVNLLTSTGKTVLILFLILVTCFVSGCTENVVIPESVFSEEIVDGLQWLRVDLIYRGEATRTYKDGKIVTEVGLKAVRKDVVFDQPLLALDSYVEFMTASDNDVIGIID